MNEKELAKEQLKRISELEDGWGFDGGSSFEAYTEESIKFYSSILDVIIEKFGDDKAPYIFPLGENTVQFEYDTEEFGYIEFEIHQDNDVGILFIKREEPQYYDDYDEKVYDKDITDIIIECIKRYFTKNLYHNLPMSHSLHIPPGETVLEVLNERELIRKDFLQQLNMSDFSFDDFVLGKKKIDKELANRLYQYLGVPQSFWWNLQANYDKEVK